MHLSENEHLAIHAFRTRLEEKYGQIILTLFGSKARGDGNAESDIDLLILMERQVDIALESQIFQIGFEIELEYDVTLGLIVMNAAYWDSIGRQMPLRWNIDREGIAV